MDSLELGIKEESIKKKKKKLQLLSLFLSQYMQLIFYCCCRKMGPLQGPQQVGLEHGRDEAHCNNCPPVETVVLTPD